MAQIRINYTELAKNIALRYPFFTSILTQINFWVIAYSLFALLVYFITNSNNKIYGLDVPVELDEALLTSVTAGAFYGLILGLLDFITDNVLDRLSLGTEVMVKVTIYLLSFLFVWFAASLMWRNLSETPDGLLARDQQYFFSGLLVYTTFSILLVSFIRQVNKSFGPGVLVPVLLGRYRKPVMENRIFLFIDLTSSTTYAEKLGPHLYSELVQECFRDANILIPRFNAQIYQYVGDEIVLTWQADNRWDYFNALGYFQSFIKQIQRRKDYYLEKFGILPAFKAGLHMGAVVVAEVGEIKREIAYHGDTINIASRLEHYCNDYSVPILISESYVDIIGKDSSILFQYVDEIQLKGRSASVQAYTLVDQSSSSS